MGKVKYKEEIKRFFEKTPVVTTRDIRAIISSLKQKFRLKEGYVYLLIHNLIEKGEIKKLTKGFYTIHDDPSLAVLCFKPAYIGLYDALSYHQLWEQATNPIILTSKKVRPGIRKVLDSKVIIHRLDKRYLFGFELKKVNGFWIPISDVEKTFIDLLYFKLPLDKELQKRILERINKKKFKCYASSYPKKLRKRLLSYL